MVIEHSFDKVFDTQRIYRQTLDSMARPGKINALSQLNIKSPQGLNQAAAAIALTMLDSETNFHLALDDQDISEYLTLNTGASNCLVNGAEFIIACADRLLPELKDVNCGTLLSPEKGATVLFMVHRLGVQGKGITLNLTGPGIAGTSRLVIAGMHYSNLEIMASLNQEYPVGVDMIFADDSGNVACIPRSSTVRWEGEA